MTSRRAQSTVLICVLLCTTQKACGQDTQSEISSKIDTIFREVARPKPFFEKYLLPLVPGLVSLLALYVTYRLTKGGWEIARDNASHALRMARADAEAKVIREKLDDFFGPLRQLLSTSSILYEALRSKQPDPSNFRALEAVLQGHEFDSNSRKLLEEIIGLGQSAERLIAEKAGLIDQDIEPVLYKLQAHYRVLRLAYAKALNGEFERFQDYVFPRGVDRVIEEKASNLRKRMTWLLSAENPA